MFIGLTSTCFYCRRRNVQLTTGDPSSPAPNVWGYARDGAGELLCCSRCLAYYHAGMASRIVPMENPADADPLPLAATGTVTIVEPWSPGH